MQNLPKTEDTLLIIDENIDDISIISADTYNVERINTIPSDYKHLRQKSKAP